MDFFARQDAARRSTWLLVGLFALAVLGILLALNAVAFAVAGVLGDGRGGSALWRPELYGTVSLAALATIAGGSLFRIASLAAGGPAVARMMGARPLREAGVTSSAHGEAEALQEQTLRNVVEEISIASGHRVPGVYVMDGERGINAFAAGRSADDAVIAVTRGCLQRLTRDELQGVVGHEFSHLLNGDARLNLRLIGVNYGILVIGLLGIELLRAVGRGGTFGGGRGRERDRGGNEGKGLLVVLAAGVGMAAVGFVGVFFGKLIQAAVSRRREYLADASAVQFTRNPAGLAGALRKIGGSSVAGTVENRHAGELAHLFFADHFTGGLGDLFGLFATHPPIAKRIRAIDPEGVWTSAESAEAATPITNRQIGRRSGPSTRIGGIAALAGSASDGGSDDPTDGRSVGSDSVARRVGTVRPADVQYAAVLIDALPAELRAACREPFTARAVLFALLAGDDAAVREAQLADLDAFDRPTRQVTAALADLVDDARRRQGDNVRLALLDLALPALDDLSEVQAAALGRQMKRMIAADRHVSAFEFAVYTVATRHLSRRLAALDGRRAVGGAAVYGSVSALLDEARVVLSELARAAGEGAGERSERSADVAYAAGASRLGYGVDGPGGIGRRLGKGNLDRLGLALDKLGRAGGGVRRRVIDAAAQTVAADGEVGPREAELLRAVAAALDVPLPPLVRQVELTGAGDGA